MPSPIGIFVNGWAVSLNQTPNVTPGLRRPPLPAAVGEEYLDEQGLEPMGLEGEALGDYLA
jgi:hypothetical protein